MLDFLLQGIQAIFSRWTALQLAVDGQWAGIETDEKYMWFVQTMSDFIIKDVDNIDPIDIEEALDQIISEEFFVQLEDDSAYQIASSIAKLYAESKNNNFAMLNHLKATAVTKDSQIAQSKSLQISPVPTTDITVSEIQSYRYNPSGDGDSEPNSYTSSGIEDAKNDDNDDDEGWIKY